MDNNSGTFTKILNGINNTLNVANKAIPIYNQAKPLFTSVNKTYKTIKNSKNDLSKMLKLMKVKNQIKKDLINNLKTTLTQPTTTSNTYSNINNPKFFI